MAKLCQLHLGHLPPLLCMPPATWTYPPFHLSNKCQGLHATMRDGHCGKGRGPQGVQANPYATGGSPSPLPFTRHTLKYNYRQYGGRRTSHPSQKPKLSSDGRRRELGRGRGLGTAALSPFRRVPLVNCTFSYASPPARRFLLHGVRPPIPEAVGGPGPSTRHSPTPLLIPRMGDPH